MKVRWARPTYLVSALADQQALFAISQNGPGEFDLTMLELFLGYAIFHLSSPAGGTRRLWSGSRRAQLDLFPISMRRGSTAAEAAAPRTVISSRPFSKSALMLLSSIPAGKDIGRLKAP